MKCAQRSDGEKKCRVVAMRYFGIFETPQSVINCRTGWIDPHLLNAAGTESGVRKTSWSLGALSASTVALSDGDRSLEVPKVWLTERMEMRCEPLMERHVNLFCLN